MARLLTPEDFGVFAMVVPLGIIASNVANQCVQTALLQSRDLTAATLNGFFWFITRMNVGAAVILAGGGLALSYFYSEPRVVGVAVAWALTLLFLVPASFQEALLKRDLRFPEVMAVQLSTLGLSIGVSLYAAWRGVGYWALPIQLVCMEIGRAIGIFFLSDWRPGLSLDRDPEEEARLRRAWRHLVGLRFSTWLNELPDIVAVGRVGGAVVLGHYDTARRWASYAFVEPFLALTDVTIASVRHVQDDPERYRHLVGRAFLVMLTISLPIMAFVAVEAESVLLVLLGPQWGEAAAFMRLLAVAAFAIALIRVNRWIYLTRGRTGRLLAWSMYIETPMTALAVLIGVRWGPYGVATAVAVVAALLIVPAVLFAIRDTPMSFLDIVRAAARPTIASALGALALEAAGAMLPAPPGLRLAPALLVFAVAFLTIWHAIPGGVADTRALTTALGDLFPRRSGRRA